MSYGAYDCYKKRSGVCLGCSRVLWEIYEEFMLAIVILGWRGWLPGSPGGASGGGMWASYVIRT